jgi:hypothetical protein
MGPVRDVPWWSALRRRTPASLDARASQGARRTASWSAGHLRHWCPAPPGAPCPSFEADGKGERASLAARNVKWPGSMALAMPLFDK